MSHDLQGYGTYSVAALSVLRAGFGVSEAPPTKEVSVLHLK